MGGVSGPESAVPGPKFCSMKITEDIRKMAEEGELFEVQEASGE